MNFKDSGIIIAKKPLKESMFMLSVFTKHYGLYSGVVRGSLKKSASNYSEGNLVDFFWQARLHEHVGTAKCEVIKSYSGVLISNKAKLYAFNSIVSLIKAAFHEREPHNNFFPVFESYMQKSINSFSLRDYIKLELSILNESGYGLQLDECAATGETFELCYVSPKSGKAVSRQAGLPYADKLLQLPKFFSDPKIEITHEEIKQAFDLTSYFFDRYFLQNSKRLQARQVFIEYILSTFKNLNES
jgi:DNA repair protein RecO (recombination protein O)